jgi:HEAT repeat protein
VFYAPDHGEVHQMLSLRLDDAIEFDPSIYATYNQQLGSKDEQVRREAAQTLATLAPPALEPLLLTFASSKDYVLKGFAPLALANLSTKTSLSALAQMLLHTDPGTYEFMTAAQKLGRTHDPSWFPVLLAVAEQDGAMYLSHAAESGGETAIPALLDRLGSMDTNTRNAAIYALGHTDSRASVPILISLLGSQASPMEDAQNETMSANAALQQLTHFYAEAGANRELISSWHRRWQQWRLASGASANIYKPGECVADTLLP